MTPLTVIRFGLPLALGAIGAALILFGSDSAVGAGVVVIGCAVLVSLSNALVRFSVGEMQDRARDQDARDFYSAHGRWPDDPEAPAAALPPAAADRSAPTLRGHPGIISKPAADREGRRRPLRPRRPPRRPRPGP